MSTTYDFTGKKVLVTGAGTGIGKGIATGFSEAGADVVFHYSHSSTGADEAVQHAVAGNRRAKAIRADFSEPSAPQTLVEEAVAFLGGLDVVINNAGITANVPFLKTTAAQYDLLQNVNIRAMYFVSQAAAKMMAVSEGGHGGVILNLSSVHSVQGCPEHTVYAMTKGAIVSFSRSLAVELAPQGIRVNVLAPGGVQVENWESVGGGFHADQLCGQLPSGFVSTPADMAKLALFLASDDARYIVGHTLIADGGQTAVMGSAPRYTQASEQNWGGTYVKKD